MDNISPHRNGVTKNVEILTIAISLLLIFYEIPMLTVDETTKQFKQHNQKNQMLRLSYHPDRMVCEL